MDLRDKSIENQEYRPLEATETTFSVRRHLLPPPIMLRTQTCFCVNFITSYANRIRKIEGLEGLKHLEVLWLSDNGKGNTTFFFIIQS